MRDSYKKMIADALEFFKKKRQEYKLMPFAIHLVRPKILIQTFSLSVSLMFLHTLSESGFTGF